MNREGLIRQLHSVIEQLVDQPQKQFVPGQTPILTGAAVYDSKEVKALIDAALTGWWALHEKGREFEKGLADYLQINHSVYVNSGSSASLLALNGIKEQRELKGGEVITPACTFPTTLNPIIQLGFTPAFVDINKTLNPGIEKIHAAINSKTVGIFLPHTMGNPFQASEVKQLADANNLFLIEDCCDALGSEYDGKKVGTFGDASTFSFYPAHILTTGEGGAVATNSSRLERIIRSLRDWGKDCWCQSDDRRPDGACQRRFDWKISNMTYDHRYVYSQIGYNLKPLELQAAMGVVQLERIPAFKEARIKNLELYKKYLEGIEGIELPQFNQKASPVLFGLPITITNPAIAREDLLKYLNSKKIATRLMFAGNIINQPAYKKMKYAQYGSLEETDRVARNTFWIGIHPALTEEMISYVGDTLKNYFEVNKARKRGIAG